MSPILAKFATAVGTQAVSNIRPSTPWAIAASQRAQFVQDAKLPPGYKRIKLDAVIKAAKDARIAQGIAVDTAKATDWPEWNNFDEDGFHSTRLAFYQCILNNQSGIFRTFKSTLTLVARNAACSQFQLDDIAWIGLSDEVFTEWCSKLFGPANKKEALRRLKAVRLSQSDAVDSQAVFLAKFDAVCYEHELIVNDISDCCDMWPTDADDIECSPLDAKEIQKTWLGIFPKQEGRVFSVQMKKCREYIEANQYEPFNIQVRKLRQYFLKKDKAAKSGDEVYSTTPSRTRSSSYRTPISDTTFDSSRSTAFKRNRQDHSSSRRFNAQNAAIEAGRGNRQPRVVAGHARGLSCGSINNHFGLGCSKDTCPIFGTQHDKSLKKAYVWKSSDVEKSVWLENDAWNALMAKNPKILDNWKKARNQNRRPRQGTKVSALQADEDDEEFNQDQIDNIESESEEDESDSDDDAVKEQQYCPNASIAETRINGRVSGFEELGHEDQFYGVTRFANNNEFIVKTLLDPGATINIMCPTIANRSQIQRKQLAVNIFQGKRKQASVEEMVQCAYELMNSDGTWVKYVDWFAVCDLGYDVLLGRRFCREQGLTLFDAKLQSFDQLSSQSQALNVNALSTREQTLKVRFDRVQAEAGEARYKRQAKQVVAKINANSSIISKDLLTASHKLSVLRVIQEESVGDVHRVKLSFSICGADKTKAVKKMHWFNVDADRSGVVELDNLFVSELMAESPMLIGIQSRYVTAKAPIPQAAKSVETAELTTEEVAAKRKSISEQTERTRRRNDLKFASFHPVQKYRLRRSAEPPLSTHKYKPDRRNYLANYDYKGEKAAIKAAYEMAEIAHDCRRKERQFRKMVNTAKQDQQNRGMSPDINCWIDAIHVQKQFDEREEASVAALVSKVSDEQFVASTFERQEYVEIVNAVQQPQLNGQRIRLYERVGNDQWIVQILGKHGLKMLCRESFFKKLSPLEQQRSVPAGGQISFEDVGIDATGQPDVDLKNIAHRQFGEAYSAELTKRIEALKAKFPQVFTEDVSEPCDFEPMKIRLIPNAVLPSKAKYYRNTPKMREEVRRQIQEQLSWGAIRKCITPCVSDVLLVKRPHMPGKFRFVVSYVKLNDATVKEQLIMPDAKSQHERLAGKKIFGAIDFSSYYRQIRLHEDSQYLTGFASEDGTYCYTRVPMGVTGACQWAQKVLQDALAQDEVLGPLGFRNYFDDLPFGADTPDEFMAIMEALLNFCVKWKLKVNPSKSVFGVTSITHVGFIVSEHGIQIDPERTRDIAELEAPKSIKKVQSVLGVLNYVRNFISGFSSKAKFLTDKLASTKIAKAGPTKRPAEQASALSIEHKSNTKATKVKPTFSWSEDDQRQFEELRLAVLNAPMLSQLDYSKPIYIRCDASRFGAGAVLFQYDDRGYEFPVCYASRKFLPAERNWSTFSQEASTVVWALERFAEYTQGYHTIVECDHRNISFVKRSAMPQLARWRLRLQDMDFTIRYLSGARNLCSDGLSRSHVDDEDVVQAGMGDVIPECALPDMEPSTATMVEVAAMEAGRYVLIAPYDTRSRSVAANAIPTEPNALVASEPDYALDEVDISESDDDSSQSSSSNDGDDEEQPSVFGPEGELLNDEQQPLVREEPQPAHLQLPSLDSATEIPAVHNDLLGHAGTFVTLQRVLRNSRQWATRKQMIIDIDNFIRACPCCQKMRKRDSRNLVQRHTISGSPFSELSVDVLKLPSPDAFGFKYVVVVVDSFSHWTSIVAVKNKSAFEAARAVMQVVGNFGTPLRIRSDGGSEFVNGVLVGLQRLMGIAPHVILPYHPTANGIVERANRSILERLREMIFSKRLVRHSEHIWSDLLPLVQRAINASIHSATGTSPARILFGKNLDLDRCLLTSMPNSRDLDVSAYVDALSYNQRIILRLIVCNPSCAIS